MKKSPIWLLQMNGIENSSHFCDIFFPRMFPLLDSFKITFNTIEKKNTTSIKLFFILVNNYLFVVTIFDDNFFFVL